MLLISQYWNSEILSKIVLVYLNDFNNENYGFKM